MRLSLSALALPFVVAAQAPPVQAPAAESPKLQRGLKHSEPGASPGYILFSPLRARHTYLIDLAGQVVHTWDSPHPPLSVYLREDGKLLRGTRIDDNPTFHGGGLGGRILELAKDGSVTWEYVLSDEQHSLHHDFKYLPNGHLLAIAWERLTREEALALGRDPTHTHPEGWWPDWLLEVEPTRPSGGKIVWEWHARDHLIQDLDPARPNFGTVADHPERLDINADHHHERAPSAEERREQEERAAEMRALGYSGDDDDKGEAPVAGAAPPPPAQKSGDWLHTNSVDYQPATDLVLLSSPELCEIFVIDHSTTTAEARGSSGGRFHKGGDLLYRWGNPRNYGRGGEADQQLFYQHEPEWIAPGLPGAGHVTVFNNGSKRPGGEYSSLDELELPFDPAHGFACEPARPFGPAKPVWSYSDPKHFYSFFISGCQRLANGDTFVCSGKQGRFFEVTTPGEIVWEYWNPYGGEFEMGMGKAGGPPPGGPPPGAPPGAPPAPGGAGAPAPGGGNPVEPTSCFRATHLAPDHPGLKALGIVP